jgi:acetyl-CoA carboxylase carboxyl transferase subunit alpha
MFSDDGAIIGGLARLNDQPVMIIAEEKGRTTKERLKRNFGYPRPEGYRKALRLMKLAERFQLPIITLIDTQGAYPGIDAEERNQSEAIARNLFEMSTLKTPIICVVIGEGGSGGALAIGVGDRILMLQYSIYSAITPEGCASILWRNADKVASAAESMKLTAKDAFRLKIIDEIIKEPLGGAHRDFIETAQKTKRAIIDTLKVLQIKPIQELLNERYERLMFKDIGYEDTKPIRARAKT